MSTVLTIGELRYKICSNVDVERLRTEVVLAAQTGGDLVHIAHESGSTDVLVTAAQTIRFDYVAEHVGDASKAVDTIPPADDIDYDW